MKKVPLSASYIHRLQVKPNYPKYISLHWADYIELLCLANLDGELSEADIIDRFSERERDLREGDPTDIEKLKLFEEESGTATRRAEINDQWNIQLEDWFKVIRIRASNYGVAYPFEVTENEIRRKSVLTSDHKIYIYLLLCSNLYLFDKRSQITLTSAFEIICYEALKAILPTHAEIHLFGSNPLNSKGRYNGTLSFWDKMSKLASDLCEQVNSRVKESDYPKKNKGDDGLDIVAWIPVGDSLPTMPIFFGQCACTTDWVTKQNDSAFHAWSNKINFTNYINNLIFIPFCYRGADGNWFKIGDIRLSFLLDRKRIMHNLGTGFLGLKSLAAATIIDEIIAAREEVV